MRPCLGVSDAEAPMAFDGATVDLRPGLSIRRYHAILKHNVCCSPTVTRRQPIRSLVQNATSGQDNPTRPFALFRESHLLL